MNQPIFYGEYDLTIDEKGRLQIPADVRHEINSEAGGLSLWVVVGVNRKPWLYVDRYYEALAGAGPQEIVPGFDMLAFDQMNFAMANKFPVDKQGRVLIPEKTLRRLGINREITMIGVRDHLELWNRDQWESHREALEQRRPEISAARHQYRQPSDKPPG